MIKGETVEPQVGQFLSGVIMMKEYNILGGQMNNTFGSVLQMSCPTEDIQLRQV